MRVLLEQNEARMPSHYERVLPIHITHFGVDSTDSCSCTSITVTAEEL